MNLLYNVTFPKIDLDLDVSTKYLFLGSCFSNSLGDLFKEQGFSTLINPFGVVYNPKSISDTVTRIANKRFFEDKDIEVDSDGRFFSYSLHSSFNSDNREEFLRNVNTSILKANWYLKTSDIIFITLGSSFVFEKDGEVVSNCHKEDPNIFKKDFLDTKKIKEALKNIIEVINNVNKQVKIIFTISPIRYHKENIFLNGVNKGLLFTSLFEVLKEEKATETNDKNIGELDKQVNSNEKYSERVIYFPIYELILDELRDYRFFKEDYSHPNNLAVSYIWSRLTPYFNNETKLYLKEIEIIKKNISHKVRNKESISSQDFFKQNINRINLLEKKYSTSLKTEKEYFSNLLIEKD